MDTPTYTHVTDSVTVPAESIRVGDWVFPSPASVMTCAPKSSPTRTARRVASIRTDDVDGLGRLTYIGYVTTGPRSESVHMAGDRVTIPANSACRP